MIAAAVQSLSDNRLPINWFDAAVLILLGFGAFRGRKNGMTRELAPLVQWLLAATVPALGYVVLARYFNGECHVDKLRSALAGYLAIAIALFLIFTPIKRALKKRAESGGLFGGGEYYLGMCAGPVRYASMILFALALLNARFYTSGEIAAKKAYDERWYGGGLYSGNYFPDLHTAQNSIFKDSFLGPLIASNLSILLIQTGPGNGGADGPKKPQPVIHIGN
ncbi:MAG: CvpA family protein [Limisphaerales bacterium]